MNKINEIGTLDKEILDYLCTDSRISNSKLSKNLKQPRHVIEYRRNKLKKLGIITGTKILLNYNSLGFKEYLIYLKFHDFFVIRDSLKEFLISSPQISWASEVFPHYNIRITVISKDENDVENFLNDLENKFPNKLIDKNISIVSELLKSQPYSTKKLKRNSIKISKIDKEDLMMLKVLEENSESSLFEIASKTKLSIEGTRKKLNRLYDSEVINLIYCNIDPIKIGLPFWCIFYCKIKNFEKHSSKLSGLLYSSINFGRTRKLFGDWNLEISISIEDHKKLSDIIKLLNEKFGEDFELNEMYVYLNKFVNGRIPEVIFKDV